MKTKEVYKQEFRQLHPFELADVIAASVEVRAEYTSRMNGASAEPTRKGRPPKDAQSEFAQDVDEAAQ